jgi:TolA-binding protein
MAFEQILGMDPVPPEAPEAQYLIAETYILENKNAEALAQLERVVKLFPNSPVTPAALYRAGVLSEEQGNIREAERYFQRVRTGYPGSDEARQAAEKLRRLKR